MEEVGLEPHTFLSEDEQDVVKQGLTDGMWGYYSEPQQVGILFIDACAVSLFLNMFLQHRSNSFSDGWILVV